MKANEFVKKYGWAKSYDIIARIPEKFMPCYYSNVCYCMKYKKYSDRFNPRDSLVNMAWLKRLVESHELVDSCGGLDKSKSIINKSPSNAESYQGGYYFRESHVFEFHNGIHEQWNLTENNGEYFKKRGFNPVNIDRLSAAIADVEACQ